MCVSSRDDCSRFGELQVPLAPKKFSRGFFLGHTLPLAALFFKHGPLIRARRTRAHATRSEAFKQPQQHRPRRRLDPHRTPRASMRAY